MTLSALVIGKASVVSTNDLISVRIETSDGIIDCQAKDLILATGSETIIPDIPGADLDVVTDSDRLLRSDRLPSSLVIIGGGVIGTEFASFFTDLGRKVTVIEGASFFTDLGRKVTVIEGLPRILNGFDKEISRNAQMILKKRGADIHTGSRVTSISKGEDGSAVVVYETDGNSASVTAEAVMIAVGRRAVTDVAEIGDITAGPQLAHKASAEGENTVMSILDNNSIIWPDLIPACVYTSPEIACVGMTESEAEAAGIDVVSVRALTSANAKSVITGEERGFVKLVADRKDRKLIGAQLMCANATDMIGELTLAISQGITTIEDCASVMRAHPTYEECVGEAFRLLEKKLGES